MSAEPIHASGPGASPLAREHEGPARVEALHAGPLGAVLAGLAAGGGVLAARASFGAPELDWVFAACFLGLVVQQDTRQRQIPNWLTGAGLLIAIGSHAVAGGATMAGLSLLHAFVPFVLLIVPFAVGAIGAGDVKVFMVLGALFGAGPALVMIAATLIIAGVVAVIWLWSQGEIGLLIERAWARMRGVRPHAGSEDVPARGRALSSALPLGAAIAFAAALQALLEGAPS